MDATHRCTWGRESDFDQGCCSVPFDDAFDLEDCPGDRPRLASANVGVACSMMDLVCGWAEENWEGWFGEPANTLSLAMLAGGPAHRDRVSAFVSRQGETTPSLFIKLGRGDVECARVEREGASVLELSETARQDVAAQLPRVYGIFSEGNVAAVAYSVVPGRRLLVPQLTSRKTFLGGRSMRKFWRETASWGLSLAELTTERSRYDEGFLGERVDRFSRAFALSGRDRVEIEAFQRDVEGERIRWQGCWQHGDMAVGNALVDQGKIRLLDWEAASGDYEPWFDVSTGPIAAVVLACRQTGRTVPDVAEQILSPSWWTGRILREETSDRWCFPMPTGWAIVLSAMQMALRRVDEERTLVDDYFQFARVAVADANVSELVHSLGEPQ